ncbi:porphobilinogen synthase [Algoriphagus sp.]|uniref:porphobilinogen synthase n=1 Tax=Algoriphagus sp. TaxID=1872435 RepID=UPI0032949CF7
MLRRPRRNRKSEAVRNLVEETSLSVKDLIFPMFLVDGVKKTIAIDSMPGINRYSLDTLLGEIESCMKLGIHAFDVFPAYPDSMKNATATESYNPETFYLKALREIKKQFPEACLMSDVAMDPYSSDGHDGLVKNGKILNDETLEILARMSLAQADAGVDILGPSDMMDGRVGYIRELLDENGFVDTSIMSYTAKYASAFYGPFRDALDSAPKFGDKKTYQMNPANAQEALIEADLDAEEGADFLMVKPALSYLDIIKLLKDNYSLPIAAYNVSGEYSMIKASAQKGWIDNDRAMMETLLSMKRAGAKVILTYFAKEYASLSK